MIVLAGGRKEIYVVGMVETSQKKENCRVDKGQEIEQISEGA